MSSYNDGEVLSITYEVSIGGSKLDLERKQCIQSISVKETTNGSNTATIEILDPEMIFIEDDIFLEEKDVVISLGWSNTTYRTEFKGYISKVDIDFSSDGVPKLSITCLDGTHDMNREKKNNTWENTTSAEVVKEICSNYGMSCKVDESYDFTTQETITQSDMTDIEFIVSLAGEEVHPFQARLDDEGTFHYEKAGELSKSSATLTYRKYPHEIISFSPSINKEEKKDKITSATTDTSEKETDSAESGDSSSSSGSNTPIENSGHRYNAATGHWSVSKR